MCTESEIDKAIILVDPEDIIVKTTLQFIANVIGEQFFDIIDGEVESRPAPSDDGSVEDAFFRPSKMASKPGKNPELEQSWMKFIRSSKPVCQYPVLYLHCESLICYAGLCTVVRQMVHHAEKSNPTLQVISLLVSNWTKFCESDLPRATKQLFDGSKTGNSVNLTSDVIPSNVQFILQQLEVELKTAKNIKNKRKYHGSEQRKWIAKLVEESFEGKYYTDKLKDEYIDNIIKDLSKMWSPYLIGFQMTVADLIAASMVFQILSELGHSVDLERIEAEVPLVFRWLRQLLSIPVVKSSAKNLWIDIMSENSGIVEENVLQTNLSWRKLLTTIEPVSQTKLEQKNNKIRVQHQSKINSTLMQIEDSGLSAECFDLDFVCTDINWENLPLDLNPSKGDLNKDRAIRKQKQIANLYSAVIYLAKPGHTIVDFCAGGGHVGIFLAYFLPACQVILVENKEQSVSRAVSRILNLGIRNIRICHSNLDFFCGHFDIGVTLHACGVATDLVLNACLRERASFVVTPCCYGSIKTLETISYPRSKTFQCNLCVKDYMVLTHSADMTSWDKNSVKNHFATSSMALIDIDRCYYMQQFGYVTKLCTMIPADCTPKNHILIGELPS